MSSLMLKWKLPLAVLTMLSAVLCFAAEVKKAPSLSAVVPRIKAERSPDLLKLPWNRGVKLPMNVDRNGKPWKTGRTMTLLHDGNALYMRYTEQTDPKKLEGNPTTVMWSDDTLEIFFARKNAKPYTQLALTALGKKASFCSFPKEEAHFNGVWHFAEKVKIVLNKKDFAIYISIPQMYLLPGGVQSGETFHANFFRHTPSSGASCWNPIYAIGFSTIERAGKITLAK